ncbi:YeeE/YedE thiosulfate transporter family protein [Clostridium sp. KNHs214]|uniref:YeeE/YedE thiosulfate transporter family protein n=1 Tax=Clostridium sp. KNHs214 TaxID=1540257 RepID=UPI00054D9C01|nr:YeeE/YedE thiosulfate transporter family protein [Clostridium sp. KNHs214]
MFSNEIDELVKQRQSQVRKEKSQIPYGIMLILIAFMLCIIFWQKQPRYVTFLSVGIIIGIILRYSRFCFTAAFRDPFITGSTRVLRGMILSMMVSTIGFAVIQSRYIHSKGANYEMIPGAVSSVGVHVMIGAFIFGIGMVLAGGCASGVLMRIGEGHALHWVVLIGFIIGTLLGAKDYSFWYEHFIKNAKTIYFSEYLDLKIVVLLQMIVLMILYKLAVWYENRRFKEL